MKFLFIGLIFFSLDIFAESAKIEENAPHLSVENYSSIAQYLKNIPASFKNNFTMSIASKALQQGDAEKPRIFSFTQNTVMTVTDKSKQGGNEVEFLSYNDSENSAGWELYSAHEQKDGMHGGKEKNPQRCLNCHGLIINEFGKKITIARPLWGQYGQINNTGILGSVDDHLTSTPFNELNDSLPDALKRSPFEYKMITNQFELFQKIKKQAKENEHYSFLNFSADLDNHSFPYYNSYKKRSVSNQPNFRLGIYMYFSHENAIAKRVLKSSEYENKKYSLLFYSICANYENQMLKYFNHLMPLSTTIPGAYTFLAKFFPYLDFPENTLSLEFSEEAKIFVSGLPVTGDQTFGSKIYREIMKDDEFLRKNYSASKISTIVFDNEKSPKNKTFFESIDSLVGEVMNFDPTQGKNVCDYLLEKTNMEYNKFSLNLNVENLNLPCNGFSEKLSSNDNVKFEHLSRQTLKVAEAIHPPSVDQCIKCHDPETKQDRVAPFLPLRNPNKLTREEIKKIELFTASEIPPAHEGGVRMPFGKMALSEIERKYLLEYLRNYKNP